MEALYENSHDLRVDPFGLSPDARLSFGHSGYRRARAYMRYALERAEGFAVLTGASGTGKTTLVNEVRAQLNNTRIHLISPPGAQLSARDMRHLVATSLGVSVDHSDRAALLLQIEEALIQRQRKCQRVVLILDDAHDLPARTLNELRVLADMQHRGRLMVQVFLVGQEPLLGLIRAPGMEQLRQRIIAAAHLQPLSIAETADYIGHRLWRAGWQHGPAITAGAVESIHDFSVGIPRRVNLISSRLLVLGAVEGKRTLDRGDVQALIAALQEEMRFEHPGLSPRSATQHGPNAPKRPGDRQNEVGVHASVRSDKAPATPDPAVPLEMFGDEVGDRSDADPGVLPAKSRPVQPTGAQSFSSCQLPCQPTSNGWLDTDMTSVRDYWNTDAPDEKASRKEDTQVRALLKDLSGYTGQTLHPLSGARIKIGRRTDAENTVGPGITIKCLCVSRNHALIERRGPSYWISDLGSVNGTYVNNERVSGQRCLHDGDTVRVARYEFQFTSASDLLRSA